MHVPVKIFDRSPFCHNTDSVEKKGCESRNDMQTTNSGSLQSSDFQKRVCKL